MKIISNKSSLKKLLQKEKKLGFIPTMGAIHKGHMSLIKKAIRQNNKTLVSIFINKPQFNKKSDFKKYPRVLKKDIRKLRSSKVDFLYLPKFNEIYPKGVNRKIKVHIFKNKLCGKYRPGHFEAIVDVVDRFINIIRPKKVYFGKKDMQQLIIIKDFVNKNYPSVKIIGCKTVRERNGVACSSRNLLLSKNEFQAASKIYNFFIKNKKKIIKKKININFLKNIILTKGATQIDYIKVLDINKIIRPFVKKKKYKIFISYYLNKTRLIDNI